MRFRYRFCRGSLVDSLSIISHSHPLVKRFSKLFSKKFFACRSGGVCSLPSARLADYITFPAACQGGGEDFFRGGLTGWLPVCPALSFPSCPHPPDPLPLRGRGRIVVFLCKGLRPLHPRGWVGSGTGGGWKVVFDRGLPAEPGTNAGFQQ